jgi:hypothetical protein
LQEARLIHTLDTLVLFVGAVVDKSWNTHIRDSRVHTHAQLNINAPTTWELRKQMPEALSY